MRATMTDSVHYFVKGLFRGMLETDEIAEQRDELEAHIRDRIADNAASGMDGDAAFAKAVEGLGNLDELIETMTGRKKKVYVNRAKWHMMLVAAVYGTLYMIAVGIWFALDGFGATAIYIALPGWLGFIVPALLKLVIYVRNPFETQLYPLENTDAVKVAIVGWAVISATCWAVNFAFMRTELFLSVVWAWMPMAGLFSWPLLETMFLVFARKRDLASPDAQ